MGADESGATRYQQVHELTLGSGRLGDKAVGRPWA